MSYTSTFWKSSAQKGGFCELTSVQVQFFSICPMSGCDAEVWVVGSNYLWELSHAKLP